MKIAVPTNDGVRIAAHFGMCRELLVFDVRDGQAILVGRRGNAGCHGPDGGPCAQRRGGFLATLSDCDMVLYTRIGGAAIEALRSVGISAAHVDGAGTAEEIVKAFASGALRPPPGGGCQCHIA